MEGRTGEGGEEGRGRKGLRHLQSPVCLHCRVPYPKRHVMPILTGPSPPHRTTTILTGPPPPSQDHPTLTLIGSSPSQDHHHPHRTTTTLTGPPPSQDHHPHRTTTLTGPPPPSQDHHPHSNVLSVRIINFQSDHITAINQRGCISV